MSDPASYEEFEKRCYRNRRIAGYGFGTHMVMPCPFCAAANWQTWRIGQREDMLRVMQSSTLCASCGRSARMEGRAQDDTEYWRLIQTGGPDVPDWYWPKPERGAP